MTTRTSHDRRERLISFERAGVLVERDAATVEEWTRHERLAVTLKDGRRWVRECDLLATARRIKSREEQA